MAYYKDFRITRSRRPESIDEHKSEGSPPRPRTRLSIHLHARLLRVPFPLPRAPLQPRKSPPGWPG